MDRPLRVYGPNLYERVLTDALAVCGPALAALGIAAAIVPDTLLPDASVGGGLLAGGAVGAGVALTLAGGGLRQNRPALAAGFGLLALSGGAWLVWGIVAGAVGAIVVGAVLIATLMALTVLRRRAVRARFKPRFFSPRGFETMVQIADAMIDGDGRETVGPIAVAVRTDHLLADVHAPVTGEIKLVLVLVEWLLPLRIGRPLPFSALGSDARRRAVNAVIHTRLPFVRDIARTLKVLACVGYYGDPATMRALGYRPYEQRDRAQGADQSNRVHPDPFERVP